MTVNLPPVDRIDVDPVQLRAFQSEDQFTEVSFNLLVEVAGYVTVAACIMGVSPTWDRDRAIVGGMMVRLSKLIRSMLGQAMRHEGEIAMITGRLAFETIINVDYLVEKQDVTLFDSFVRYSLRTERKLRDRIHRNAADRGDYLPIEHRMLASVERAATASGVPLDDVALGNTRGWGNTNIRDRAVAIGAGAIYDNLFTMASHAVHGNWQDILSNHLDGAPGAFEPKIEWAGTRPQLILSIGVLSLHAVLSSTLFLGGDQMFEAMKPRIGDLDDRIRLVNEAHEAFLGT